MPEHGVHVGEEPPPRLALGEVGEVEVAALELVGQAGQGEDVLAGAPLRVAHRGVHGQDEGPVAGLGEE